MAPAAAEPARDPPGITLLAAILVATPLWWWAYVSALSHFTILDPPLTGSRGLALAMQLFFSPGTIVTIALGVGLLRRSEWTRRIARAVFLLALAWAAWVVGTQVVTSRYDANVLLAGVSLVLSAVCLWYLGRAPVREAFGARAAAPAAAAKVEAPPGRAVDHPRALVVAAWIECAFGVVAVLLVAYLYGIFTTKPLLDVGPGIGVQEADDLLRMVMFVALALFAAPLVLATVAAIGIVRGRDTVAMARRYATIACWTAVACALLTAWLVTREGFAFDVLAGRLLFAFAAVSLLWHAWLLWRIAQARPPGR